MWGGPHAVTATVIEREIAPLIIGQDPRRPEYLWEKVFQETYYHGRRGILLAALSGVDIALWDILGKCAGQPLWRLLGGFGRPVSAYASAGLLPARLRSRCLRRGCRQGACRAAFAATR